MGVLFTLLLALLALLADGVVESDCETQEWLSDEIVFQEQQLELGSSDRITAATLCLPSDAVQGAPYWYYGHLEFGIHAEGPIGSELVLSARIGGISYAQIIVRASEEGALVASGSTIDGPTELGRVSTGELLEFTFQNVLPVDAVKEGSSEVTFVVEQYGLGLTAPVSLRQGWGFFRNETPPVPIVVVLDGPFEVRSGAGISVVHYLVTWQDGHRPETVNATANGAVEIVEHLKGVDGSGEIHVRGGPGQITVIAGSGLGVVAEAVVDVAPITAGGGFWDWRWVGVVIWPCAMNLGWRVG